MKSNIVTLFLYLVISLSVNCSSFKFDSILKSYWTCAKEKHPSDCLKLKSVELIGHLDYADLPILGDSVVLIRDPKSEHQTVSEETMKSLNSTQLEKALIKRATSYISSRRILLKFPLSDVNSHLAEGRKKGQGGYRLMALMMGSMMTAMGFAALAALAGKALAASMAALMMAALAALKKHSGGHGGSSYEVISVPGGHHHRSLESDYNKPVYYKDEDGPMHEHHTMEYIVEDSNSNEYSEDSHPNHYKTENHYNTQTEYETQNHYDLPTGTTVESHLINNNNNDYSDELHNVGEHHYKDQLTNNFTPFNPENNDIYGTAPNTYTVLKNNNDPYKNYYSIVNRRIDNK